jgi:Uma2 family endonuclease
MSLAARDRMTVDEFLVLIANDELPPHAELIDGDVVVSDPTFRHNEIVLRLTWSHRSFVLTNPDAPGRIGIGSLVLDGHSNGYVPDVWWVRDGSALDPAAHVFPHAPAIAVEVRSPTTWHHDRGQKLRRYEAIGVIEVWLVDGIDDEVTVHRRSAGSDGFDEVVVLRAGDMLTTPLVPGWTVDLSEVFAR